VLPACSYDPPLPLTDKEPIMQLEDGAQSQQIESAH
jgi:hypothetical protein